VACSCSRLPGRVDSFESARVFRPRVNGSGAIYRCAIGSRTTGVRTNGLSLPGGRLIGRSESIGWAAGKRSFYRLLGFGISRGIIRKPEIAVVPENNGKGQQQQTQRPQHQAALFGVFGNANWNVHQVVALGFRCDGL